MLLLDQYTTHNHDDIYLRISYKSFYVVEVI